MGFTKRVLHQNIALFYGYFWASISTFLLTLLGFLNRMFIRYNCIKVSCANCFEVKDANFYTSKAKSNHFDEKVCEEGVAEAEINLCEGMEESIHDDHDEEEAEMPGFFFKFEFQITDQEEIETVSAILKRYDFVSGKSFTEFLEESEASNHVVKEEASAKSNPFGDHEFIGLGSEPESRITELKSSATTKFVGSFSGCGSSEKDSETTVRLDTFADNGKENTVMSDEDLHIEEMHSDDLNDGYEPDDSDVGDNYIFEEIQELEENQMQYSNSIYQSFHSSVHEGFDANKGKRAEHDLDISQKPNLKNHLVALDSEDSDQLETLWEHQDLIEQLKMEVKKVRATSLPTIFEESVCPTLMEDLKPWRIDEKIQHNGGINELPKFYKSYRERMRKFDILNYQKMYALGYLQSTDSFQSFSRTQSTSAFTSLIPHSFRLWRPKKSSEADEPMKKLIKEIYGDLETVYVGQLCLSWEFLHWQYLRGLEQLENDPCLSHSYNEVAGEFQQFQVLLQRFIENEPFQGSRVENYAKNRCRMRSLLQVPAIKEGNAKDRKPRRKARDNNNAMTSEMLVEILEESIRTIWQFIRADKDAHTVNLKHHHETQQLQNPADVELLKKIRLDLQKKEKKLKQQLKSRHCLLQNLQKHQDDETDQFLYFFSQVDMKLARRVLNMSRLTTEQLSWCRSKINNIHFVNSRIHVEPSFILFPYS